ncbi:hypothetical protein GT347_01825 [Xylophilus rhododendri]|uniref:Uncharacterized protein n=1 Tax=Xylophilus rhododendri TaxID=2697032 RepID=A0A857J1J9_9BURK|nr:hypothetical protein [Xylophilus rhododendri]QHI96838.1 hypothetical protein GT347_01825 [Xylophilus rhododendri]
MHNVTPIVAMTKSTQTKWTRRLISSFAVGVVLAALFMLLKPRSEAPAEHATTSVVGRENNLHTEQSQKLSQMPANSAIGTPATIPISAELLQSYNSGGNMRPFLMFALQHPEQGGFQYATKVMRECESLRLATDIFANTATSYSPEEDPSKFLQRSKSLDQLRTRCSDLLPSETSNIRADELYREGQIRDPLIKAGRHYQTAFTGYLGNPAQSADLNHAAADILKTGDPLLWEELGLRLALGKKDGKNGFNLAGNFYDLNADTDIGMALYLLPCSAGLRCDSQEFDVVQRCALHGECDDSRFQHVENMLRASPGAYQRVMAAFDTMRTAIQAGDFSIFDR